MLYLDGFRTLPTSAYRSKADIKTEVYERPLLVKTDAKIAIIGEFFNSLSHKRTLASFLTKP